MDILIVIAQGFMTFAAPCHLPLLPVLLALFSGGEAQKARCFVNTLAFVSGIASSFALMGALAGKFGSAFDLHSETFDLVCGLFMILLGLVYSGLLPIKLPHSSWLPDMRRGMGTPACFVFGAMFSLSFIPCSGALWGSAMLVASHAGSMLMGAIVMLAYSAGIGIPFLLAAVLTDKVKRTVGFFRKHSRTLSLLAGALLILLGILMATGQLDALLHHH